MLSWCEQNNTSCLCLLGGCTGRFMQVFCYSVEWKPLIRNPFWACVHTQRFVVWNMLWHTGELIRLNTALHILPKQKLRQRLGCGEQFLSKCPNTFVSVWWMLHVMSRLTHKRAEETQWCVPASSGAGACCIHATWQHGNTSDTQRAQDVNIYTTLSSGQGLDLKQCFQISHANSHLSTKNVHEE